MLALAAGLLAAAPPTTAQDNRPGGSRLRLGISQGLEVTDNLALAPVSAGSTTQLTTRLSFGLTRETRSDRFALEAFGVLRAARGAGRGRSGFQDPGVTLSYGRSTLGARFDLKAYARESEVEYLRPLDDFIDPDGIFLPPPDLDALTGTGTRRSYGMDTVLSWGEQAPVGLRLTAGASGLRYTGTSSAGLIDSDRQYLGATLRLALSKSAEATVGLRQSRYRDDDPLTATRDTRSLDLGLRQSWRDGTVNARLTLDDTPDGTRSTLSFGRDITLRGGALSASAGVGRGVNGRNHLIGALSWRGDLPQGSVTAGLTRSVAAGSDDTDSLVTALSLRLTHELTQLSSLNLALSLAETRDTATGTSVTNTGLSASYSHALTRDWGLNLGYQHRIRKETGIGKASSDSVSLTLSRSFDIRP